MLDGIAPEVMDEWIAYRQIEPDPDQWLREILKRGLAAICNCLGAKIKPSDLDPVEDTKEPELVTPRQAAESAAMILGAKPNVGNR